MASNAWDSSLRRPGLIVESRTVINGIVEMSGRLAAVGANCPDCAMPSTSLHSRYARTLSDLPVSSTVTATVGSTVPVHAHGLPTADVQRAVGAAGWPAIRPQSGPLRRVGACGGGRSGR